MTAQVFEFPVSAYVPLAIAFFGLGTGYLIFGPQELLGFPARDRRVDLANGWWGVWMPGFCQFVTGCYILIGLTWFHSFEGAPLYAAGVLTTLFGIHWFALGLIRMRQGDARPSGFMSVAFFLVSILGIIVFARAGDWPVCLLFIGLMTVYFSEFFASFKLFMPTSERLLGLCRVATGCWLMYLTYAVVLNLASGTHLPL
jgi:hypothetical protein